VSRWIADFDFGLGTDSLVVPGAVVVRFAHLTIAGISVSIYMERQR
jgi:hypothetical protein